MKRRVDMKMERAVRGSLETQHAEPGELVNATVGHDGITLVMLNPQTAMQLTLKFDKAASLELAQRILMAQAVRDAERLIYG